MKGKVVQSIPHPLGRRSREQAVAREHYQNERDWRRRGLSNKFDRSSPEKSRRWVMTQNGDRISGLDETGPGWEVWSARLKPKANRLYARMAPPFQQYTAIVVPDIVNRYRGQCAGAVYLVLAVGDGVTSIAPGNAIVASAHIGAVKFGHLHLGAVIGPRIRELWTDVESVQDGENDVIKRAGGDVLAVIAQEGRSMKLEPTLDRIVVKRHAADERTEGGLHIPGTAQKKVTRGEVLAVGPGKTVNGVLMPVGVAVGEVVLFGEYGGIDVRVGNEDFCILREEEIVGILRG